MQSSLSRLRPMGLGDLLDTTFALYRQNFELFAGIVAVLAVPEAIINAIIAAARPASNATLFQTSNAGTTTVSSGLTATTLVALGASAIVGVVFSLLITGALAKAISLRYLGEPASIEACYRAVGLRGFLRLLRGVLFVVLGVPLAFTLAIVAIVLVGSVLTSIAGVIGVLFYIVAGVAMVVAVPVDLTRLAFFPQAVVLEGVGAIAGLRRSWGLVRGRTARVLGALIVLFLLTAILQAAVGGIAGALSVAGGPAARAIASLLGSLVGILVQPISLTGMTLLYYDLRIRKEGFDIEHLAQHLQSPVGV